MKYISVGAFDDLLHQYLRSAGYFQRDLAGELGLHPKVLSRKLNSTGEAHLNNDEVRRIIVALASWEAITTRDQALQLLEMANLSPNIFSAEEWQTPPLGQLDERDTTHNLSAPLTRFVGREDQVAQLRKQLVEGETRLVTLVGPGGSGKTRLAQHVANGLTERFAQGVWIVYLSAVRDPDLVVQSIMQTLYIQPTPGLPASQSLIGYLRHKRMLLILDNFEQVAQAAPLIGDLLAAAPGLTVLVTSRVVLHLYGESRFKVPPLDIPDPGGAMDRATLERYGAVQLFVERAREVAPDFSLTDENAASVAQICARLDGLPLALELAAARIKVLPPELLLKRLMGARLSMLNRGARNLPGRQQALRDTIRWSYDLLSPDEQAWFARLGVFNGAWSLESSEAMMCAFMKERVQDAGDAAHAENGTDSEMMLNVLEYLLDNSLLMKLPVTAGQARFTMLETLREYALERLKIRGEIERVQDWHACYYMAVAEEAEEALKGPQQLVWCERMVVRQDNFRAALEWSIQQASVKTAMKIDDNTIEIPDVEVALRLASALRQFWEWQGYLHEARGWLEAALALPLGDQGGKQTLAARAKALNGAARLLCLQNEQGKSVEMAEQSIALWKQLDDPDPVGLATALFHRTWPALALGDLELARSLLQQGLDVLTPTGDTWLRGQLNFLLGAVSGFTGNFPQMHSYYDLAKTLFEQVGDTSAIADVLKDRGGMAILEGRFSASMSDLLESLELSRDLGYKQFIGTGLGLLGFAVGMMGKPDPLSASLQAAQLWGASHGLLGAIGSSPWLNNIPGVREASFLIRARVEDEERWRQAWHKGRTLTASQAMAAFLEQQAQYEESE